jgi:hypothetical protein
MTFKRSKSTLEYPPYARFQPQAIGQSTWLEITGIYNRLTEDPDQRVKLVELINKAGLGTNLDALSQKLHQADPLRTLRLYQRLNPKINLTNLSMEEPFEVVAGLVYLFSGA